MAVWVLTKEEKEKYKQKYQSYMENYKSFDRCFIDKVINDFNALKNTIDYNISKCHSADLNDLIEYVYNGLKRQLIVIHCQTLNEVKNFGFWDIDYGSITGTIYISENKIELSEIVSAYVDNEFEPYEDLHIEVLKEMFDNSNSV